MHLAGLTGPRGRPGKPGNHGTPGIPGITAWKTRVNGSSELLIAPSIAGEFQFGRLCMYRKRIVKREQWNKTKTETITENVLCELR